MGAATGDERFDELWAEHALAVLRWARRRVDPGDVDDVVTETFTVAWRRQSQAPEQALPWLLAIARRVAANQHRARRRREALLARVAEAAEREAPSPSTGVAEALGRLSDRDRELLTLIAWDGLTPGEAAQALGCTQAALRVRLHRARQRLRGLLAEVPEPETEKGRR